MGLLIRDNQFNAFEVSLKSRFAKKIEEELRTEYTDYVDDLNDEELHEYVLEGIDRAKSYGLEEDKDIKAFVNLLFVVGWYFDEYPLFNEFLTYDDYEHYERMEYLFDAATDEDWDEASKLSDELVEERTQNQSN
jgi:hypothetical protein